MTTLRTDALLQAEELVQSVTRSDVPGEQADAALGRCAALLARHRQDAEGPGGLFEEISRTAPRLGPRLRELSAEHDELEAELTGLRDVDRTPRRAAVEAFADHLAAHRHRACASLLEAVETDVAAGD